MLCLEEGEAVLDRVEVWLPDDCRSGLVVSFRVAFFLIAVQEREGQLSRPGPDGRRVPDVVDDIDLAEGPGEERLQQADGLVFDRGFRGQGAGVPYPCHAVVISGGEPEAVGAELRALRRADVAAQEQSLLSRRNIPEYDG